MFSQKRLAVKCSTESKEKSNDDFDDTIETSGTEISNSYYEMNTIRA
jgi:hypothetical protein